jgi:hypothetical protein
LEELLEVMRRRHRRRTQVMCVTNKRASAREKAERSRTRSVLANRRVKGYVVHQFVTKPLFMTRRGWAWLEMLLLTLATLDAFAASPKRVLMVFSADSHTPAIQVLEQAVRDRLGADRLGAVEFYSEYCDSQRFSDTNVRNQFLGYLRQKYAAQPPEVIVLVLGGVLGWELLSSPELLPRGAVVFLVTGTHDVPHDGAATNTTGLVARPDVQGTFEIIFRLQPETRRIVVIGRPDEVSTAAMVAGKAFADRAEFEFWSDRTVASMREALATLPARTVVFYGSVARDPEGHSYYPAQVARLLAEKASVPVYGWADTYLGSGVVGGSVVSYAEMGKWAGAAAERILT